MIGNVVIVIGTLVTGQYPLHRKRRAHLLPSPFDHHKFHSCRGPQHQRCNAVRLFGNRHPFDGNPRDVPKGTCVEAATKFVVLNSIGSSFTLIALILMFVNYGTLNIGSFGSTSSSAVLLISLFLFIGLGTKIGVVPMHSRVPIRTVRPRRLSARFWRARSRRPPLLSSFDSCLRCTRLSILCCCSSQSRRCLPWGWAHLWRTHRKT